MGNVSTNVYAKFCYAPLRIKKALGIFRELITTTTRTTTRVAFWDPPSGSENDWSTKFAAGWLLISMKQLQIPDVVNKR